MKACANLSTMFAELPMDERFGAARAAGFKGVEIPFPYDLAVPNILERLGQNDLDFVMIACPPPNYTGAPRGFAAVPGQEERFRRDFVRTMRYAKALGVLHVHIMAGVVNGPDVYDTLVANLRWAVAESPGQGLTLEPMCDEDMPGYYVNNALKAADIVKEIGSPDLGLQFDLHHIHQIHGDVLETWKAVGSHVTHIQLAQSPLRLAPDRRGGVDIKGFLATVKSSGYKGWISGEYAADLKNNDHLFWV